MQLLLSAAGVIGLAALKDSNQPETDFQMPTSALQRLPSLAVVSPMSTRRELVVHVSGDVKIGLLQCDAIARQHCQDKNNLKLRKIAFKVRNKWRIFRVAFNEMSDTHRELDVFRHIVELVVDDNELRLGQLVSSKFIDQTVERGNHLGILNRAHIFCWRIDDEQRRQSRLARQRTDTM